MNTDNKKQESLYRAEDFDLIESLASVGEVTTAQIHDKQNRRVNIIQIEAILRNIKAADDLKKSTDKYSLTLIYFTVALLLLGGIQFIFDILSSSHQGTGIIFLFSYLGAILFLGKKFADEIGK